MVARPVPAPDRQKSSALSPLPQLLLAVALSLALACSPAEQSASVDDTTDKEGAGEDQAAQQKAPERPPLPEGPPIDGFKQLMPRGGIPALVDPQFVTASAAKMPDDAWIMGFEHEGQAYAYDLNILNHHEVVNHKIGGLPIAAVW